MVLAAKTPVLSAPLRQGDMENLQLPFTKEDTCLSSHDELSVRECLLMPLTSAQKEHYSTNK